MVNDMQLRSAADKLKEKIKQGQAELSMHRIKMRKVQDEVKAKQGMMTPLQKELLAQVGGLGVPGGSPLAFPSTAPGPPTSPHPPTHVALHLKSPVVLTPNPIVIFKY